MTSLSDGENPSLPKGGRGLKAPYKTQTVRVPVPVVSAVEAIANYYRATGEVLSIENKMLPYDEVIKIVEDLKLTKEGKTKAAQTIMNKLVTTLYPDSSK